MWSLWIVQLERGTRAFAVETFPADFYQTLNNASSCPKPQCFLRCPARIQSISTLPGGPQSWEIPSVLLLPPHHCGTTSPERFLLKALEKRTSVLKAEISVHGEYPGRRMQKETWGLWKVRRQEWTKSQCAIFLLSPKGCYLGTSQVTLESTLLTVNISIPLSQELLLQEWGSEINAMGTLSIQCAFLIGVENVSTIYNNGGTINFSLQAEAY